MKLLRCLVSKLKLYQNFDENEPNSDMMNYESIVENIDGQTIQFNIWDTAGANMYYDEVVDFTCDANFVIIVHDISAVYNEKVEQYLSDNGVRYVLK